MDILSIKNYIELLNHKKNYNIEHSFFDILVVLFVLGRQYVVYATV